MAKRADRVVYVCNLRPQIPETGGFGVAEHVDALRRHGLEPAMVLYDPARMGGSEGVAGAIAAPLSDGRGLVHDPELLATALRGLLPTG